MWESGHPVLCPDYFPTPSNPHCADVLGPSPGLVCVIKEFMKHFEKMALLCCVVDILHRHGQGDGEGLPLLIRL